MIVAIEGLDYTGKSTLVKNLAKHYPTWFVIEYPDYTKESGKLLRSYYDRQIELDVKYVDSLLESNRGESVDEVLSHEGTIMGRSALSGVAYRLAAQYTGDTSLPEYKQYVIDELKTQLARETKLYGTKHPETVIYLDASVDEVLSITSSGRTRDEDIREGEAFQRKVELNFHHILVGCAELGIKVHMVKIFGISKGKRIRIKEHMLANEVNRCISNSYM
jgi:deoxyadenosine/deoxycytidine kinase